MKSSRFFPLLAFSALCLAGCDDREGIKVYRVAKAPVENEAPGGDTAGMPPANPGMTGMGASSSVESSAPSGEEFSSKAPAEWESKPATTLRRASFVVKGGKDTAADVSLVVLSGGAGGILDNVNRWRSQLGQAPVTEDVMAKGAQHVASGLGDVTVVDIEGNAEGGDVLHDGRIVAGVALGPDRVYFFKMRGNKELVGAQKENFIKWIHSVKVTARAAQASQPAAPAAATGPVPATTEGKPKINWVVPGTWKSAPASAMRYASFTVAGANGDKADISVSVFAGDGGGDLENVNRWRGQIGLEAVDAAALQTLVVPVKSRSGEITTVDLAGPKARVLAGWVRREGSVWFFKLNASEAVAKSEKDNFTKFLQSVQF